MLEYIQYIDKYILLDYIEELYSRNTTNEIISIYNARSDLGKMKETYVQYKKSSVFRLFKKIKYQKNEYKSIM